MTERNRERERDFRSICGFALPPICHNNHVSYGSISSKHFETSATALCGTTGKSVYIYISMYIYIYICIISIYCLSRASSCICIYILQIRVWTFQRICLCRFLLEFSTVLQVQLGCNTGWLEAVPGVANAFFILLLVMSIYVAHLAMGQSKFTAQRGCFCLMWKRYQKLSVFWISTCSHLVPLQCAS